MAKLIVAIEIANLTKSELLSSLSADRADWFPDTNKPDQVSVDEAYLATDPTEDSFKVFELIDVTD